MISFIKSLLYGKDRYLDFALYFSNQKEYLRRWKKVNDTFSIIDYIFHKIKIICIIILLIFTFKIWFPLLIVGLMLIPEWVWWLPCCWCWW